MFYIAYTIGWLGIALAVASLPGLVWLPLYLVSLLVCLVITYPDIRLKLAIYEAWARSILER